MLLALAGLSSAAMAQQKTEVVEYEIIQVQDKYQVITNPFWSNWFFSIGGGAEATFGDNDSAGSFGKRISPTLNISVGKWFTPGLGLRLQYSGLQARGFTYDKGADYVKGAELKDGYYKQRFDYMNLHGDVMFNLNALFGGYNQHRVYEIIPYVGAGFTHNYSKPHREALSVNAGIINKFRISNAVDINLELSAMAAEDKFDGEVGGDHGYDTKQLLLLQETLSCWQIILLQFIRCMYVTLMVHWLTTRIQVTRFMIMVMVAVQTARVTLCPCQIPRVTCFIIRKNT